MDRLPIEIVSDIYRLLTVSEIQQVFKAHPRSLLNHQAYLVSQVYRPRLMVVRRILAEVLKMLRENRNGCEQHARVLGYIQGFSEGLIASVDIATSECDSKIIKTLSRLETADFREWFKLEKLVNCFQCPMTIITGLVIEAESLNRTVRMHPIMC